MEEFVAMLSNPAVLAGLVLLVVFQFGLMILAVVDWVRRPPDLVRGNRIGWLLLIILVNIAGPIVYLTIGRLPTPAQEGVAPVISAGTRSAADALYGAPEDRT